MASAAEGARLRAVSSAAIDDAARNLHDLSDDIWRHPELNFEEHHAHDALAAFMERHHFTVDRHYVLDTGLRASSGGGGDVPHVALLAEYDALTVIGHACGHNLIAEVAAGAAIGVRAALQAAQQRGQHIGKVTLLGTPAEEGGGGKIKMLERGAFDDVDVALMAHPAPATYVRFTGENVMASTGFEVLYTRGEDAAGDLPSNPVDAVVSAYTSIAVLRQQLKPSYRVSAVITDGGRSAGVIPDQTRLFLVARAPSTTELRTLLLPALGRCLDAAARATQCTVDYAYPDMVYDSMVTSPELAAMYERYSRELGVAGWSEEPMSYSTDMGSVSHRVPSIHPMYYIGDSTAVNHSPQFTAVAGSDQAQPHTIKQAKVLASMAIDIFLQPSLVDTMKASLERELEQEAELGH